MEHSQQQETFRHVQRKKVPLIQKSLGVILVGLQGHHVIVELKNDLEITGIIDSSDANMNMTLINARQVFPSGQVVEMETTFVQGSTVRYVHLPNELPIVKHMDIYMKTIERVARCREPHKIVDRKRKADDDG